MTLMMNKDSAVLQGAFLLADKLCSPSSLSCIQKANWSCVGHLFPEALREICGPDEVDSRPNPTAVSWKKKTVCVVWLKLLSREAEEDVETAWRENPFFSLQNSLPEVNRVLLLELVKSIAAADIFAGFLLCLPQPQICAELERLGEHVRSNPVTEEDVWLFLDVWWELWKGRDEQKAGGEESMEAMFANQSARLSAMSSSMTRQAAKRIKLDDSQTSLPNTDVLYILINTLKDMKDRVSSPDLCYQALSISLNSLYTSFLIDQEVELSPKEKINILSKMVSTQKRKLSPALIQEAQRDLHASYTPSHFQPSCITLNEAIKIIIELIDFWQIRGLLKECSSYCAFQLEQSVQRMLTALDGAAGAAEAEIDAETVKNALRGLLSSLDLTAVESSPEVRAQVTTTIISHRLHHYKDFAVLFAGEVTWAGSDESWLDYLEKNQAAFQQLDTLTSLSSTLMRRLHSKSSDLSQCKKLMKIIADIFSTLSLTLKNKALATMLKLSSRGFFGSPVPSAVTEGFEQELNMAFNCIIQGGGGGTLQGNLNTAASLVARVAFQNPEAALRSCCHSAVFNKGACSLMAKILQQLPGLQGQRGGQDEGGDAGGSSVLCRCLQDLVGAKSLSDGEKEQLLKFVGLMMAPVRTAEGGEDRLSFLLPQEVVNNLVLPNLSVVGHGFIDVELSLQLLHTALSMDVHPAPSPHWVFNCSPFPFLYVLAQLHNQTLRCWGQPPESAVHYWSMDTKDLLVSVLTTLGQVVGAEVLAAPSSWSRPLFWLYNKMEELDWTVRFHLKPVWGEHFKNEVPSSLLDVCDLPEQDWSGLDLPQYGQGTGLLAWMECCSISDSLQSTMLSCLSLDQQNPEHVGMFSKGLLVALTQTLPWCSVSQWTRVLRTLKELITSGRLHVPFSLEYVDYLPLLDLRRFSCELRLSVLLLRVLQLLCGSSCSHWLSEDGWTHVGRLYAHAVKDMMSSIKATLPLPSSGTSMVSESPKEPPCKDAHIKTEEALTAAGAPALTAAGAPALTSRSHTEEDVGTAPSQEVLFVLSQLFCHVQHIQVMMPGGQSEPLFLSSLEILSHYQAIMAAFPESCSPLESDNTRHFFTTITNNLEDQEMKTVLQQKIAQLVSAA